MKDKEGFLESEKRRGRGRSGGMGGRNGERDGRIEER